MNDDELYKILHESNLINEKELLKAHETASTDHAPLEQILIDKGLITHTELGSFIADYYKVKFANLREYSINKDCVKMISQEVSTRLGIIIFDIDNSTKNLKVATSNPHDIETLNLLSKKLNIIIEPYYAPAEEINEKLNLFKSNVKSELTDIIRGHIKEAKNASGEDTKELSISKIVNKLVSYANQYRVSDIHIEPEDGMSLIRFRIDGILNDIATIPLEMHARIISRIKVVSKLKTDEHQSAQDGKMQEITDTNEKVDIRVSIVPITYGEKAVLRILSSRIKSYTLEDLGMDKDDLEKVKAGYMSADGMVLSTGPTASGKTTTIYSILRILNSKDVNIATIEDPVEYTIGRVNQIQVNPDTNLTFANGLKSILRQDPNIIFVGEIRDQETAKIATNSAMTGHLVLSTLHANTAVMTIPRLFNMGIEPFLIASTLRVIIAQRLVRRVCNNCGKSFEFSLDDKSSTSTDETIKYFSMVPKESIKKYFGDPPYTIIRGDGCSACHNTGYSGRIGLYEVLSMTPELSDLITKSASVNELQQLAVKQGMRTIFEDGLTKISRGETSIQEVFRVTQEI